MMAIRKIREIGDDILTKVSREVKKVDQRLQVLIDDMLDTMYDAEGVGLAAQIGVLKRVVVIDVSEERDNPIILINPEIIETEGCQIGDEGCLSIPGKVGTVERPNYVKVKAYDRDMKEFIIEGTELLQGHYAMKLIILTEFYIQKRYKTGLEVYMIPKK